MLDDASIDIGRDVRLMAVEYHQLVELARSDIDLRFKLLSFDKLFAQVFGDDERLHFTAVESAFAQKVFEDAYARLEYTAVFTAVMANAEVAPGIETSRSLVRHVVHECRRPVGG